MFATSEISNYHKRVVRTEGKVQGLCGEVPDDVGGVTSPEGEETLVTVGTRETVTNTLVGLGETTLLDLGKENSQESRTAVPAKLTDHLILVLNEELDTLNGGCGGLGDGLEDTDTVEQHVWTCHDPLRTADTPPIMKSTVRARQVSNQSLQHKASTTPTQAADVRYPPKNSLGVLPFLTSAILTEGGPEGGRN